ncbi:hypothetical protein KC19_2G077400 [Ceratodon purpureus]|uniref:DNA repair metallo-beta-lactamase domain-containing protein n=1 Tax=Ceratodon purpureus TaxID=3225 RepID=A0A8T0IUC3_CERPU|nr:hypothetical protein KC19_2G077400 [Ceratodon purpureus]
MEEAGCSLDTEARSGLAKKKRLSLRGCGAPRQSARDVSPLKIAGNAVDSKEDLDKGTQQVNIGKDSTGANIERVVDQGRTTDTEVGGGILLLPDDTQTRSGNSEGRQEGRVSSLKAKHVIIDEFCDAEEEFPYDVLEEVLSQYDKPVVPSHQNGNQCESLLDKRSALHESNLAGERENTKDMAVESLNFSERTYFEEYDVAGGMVEDFKPGFSRDDEPILIEDESSIRYQDAFDDSSAFRDDLFFDEESRDASIETTLDTRSKADSQLEESACGISDREELSFRDAFYKGGTDWSSLNEVDEYGLPCTSSPPSSYGRDCGSEDAEGIRNVEGSIEYKVVKPQLSSQSRHSQRSVSEPGLNFKDNMLNNLNRSSKLKQGDLSSFLGFKRKSPPDANVSQKKTEQRDIGTYFGLAPLAKQASAAANFLSKFRPGQTPPVAASGEYAPRKGGNGWKSIRESTRGCPFYKKMPGTPFTVDAFKFGAVEGCKAYFLSHFHADHYGGLTRSWSHGPIFCTEITARLVSMHLGVDSRWLRPVKLDFLFMVEGVEVKFLEANHCPGAALILFQTCGQRILHTGDFRACKDMQSYPDLLRARVTSLYLDTTYCSPKYNFPLQEDVIRHVVRLTTAALARNPRTLVTVGAYSIGKERVYLGIAKALKLKIYADKRRVRTLRALDWPDLTDRLCSDASRSELHVLPISHLNATKLRAYMQSFHPTYNAVLAFRPTGWTYSEKVGSNLEELRPQCSGAVTIYGVPYSEHSSYSELREFVQFLRPQKIIATVNIGSAAQREGMQAHFNQWLKC